MDQLLPSNNSSKYNRAKLKETNNTSIQVMLKWVASAEIHETRPKGDSKYQWLSLDCGRHLHWNYVNKNLGQISLA